MEEFVKGMRVTPLENVDIKMVDVVNVPYNIDPKEYNKAAKEFVKHNRELVDLAIERIK